MVSVIACYSDNLSSNPVGFLNFLYKKTKINEKEAVVCPAFKKVSRFKPGFVGWKARMLPLRCNTYLTNSSRLSLFLRDLPIVVLGLRCVG